MAIFADMKRIILITGGERSGKSMYAEQLALRLSEQPVYMATARIWDEEFRQRVHIHRERRGPQWTNIEEEKYLSRHDLRGRTVLVDCVTLWTTNFFLYNTPQPGSRVPNPSDIFVTNEIGMGGVSTNEVQRRFTDLLGWTNQFVASQADEVYLMVSGIPVKIK